MSRQRQRSGGERAGGTGREPVGEARVHLQAVARLVGERGGRGEQAVWREGRGSGQGAAKGRSKLVQSVGVRIVLARAWACAARKRDARRRLTRYAKVEKTAYTTSARHTFRSE